MMEYLRTTNGAKIKVEQIYTFEYGHYGLFRDQAGNLYFQFTDDCAEIEPCNSNNVEEEIAGLTEMFKYMQEDN